MKNLILTTAFVLANLLVIAQYTTPGTGVNWNLNDLTTNSGGVVTLETNGQYRINQGLTVAANDTVSIFTAEEINVVDGVLITISGTLISDPGSTGMIFFKALNDHYLGFRFEDSQGSYFANTYFKKAGGIKLVSSFVEFHGCDFEEFDQENATGTIDLFQSSPLIEGCSFSINDGPAVMSGANSTSSPQILGCEIIFNVVSNSNTPQINLGTTATDSIRIINCQIIGNPENIMAGGIAITTLAGGSIMARIEGNVIKNNRYGITAYGSNIGSVISSNEITDNNTQNLPMLGGSGINFFGGETNRSIVTGNIITGNLWGITIQNNAQPNFGQLEGEIYNQGANTFMNNSNEGIIYDLYNNTPNPIMAQNNYWGTDNYDTIEMHIFHQPDDPSLGLVDFLPLYIPPVGIETHTQNHNFLIASVFPNPANDYCYLKIADSYLLDSDMLDVEMINVSGETIATYKLSGANNIHKLAIPSYFSGLAIIKVRLNNFIAPDLIVIIQ